MTVQDAAIQEGQVPDLSRVRPQLTFLDSRPDKPSASSTLYIRRFSTEHPVSADDPKDRS